MDTIGHIRRGFRLTIKCDQADKGAHCTEAGVLPDVWTCE